MSLHPASTSMLSIQQRARVEAKVAKGNAEDVDAAVKNAAEAQREWADMNPHMRGKILRKVAEAIEANATLLSSLETRDMGMPVQAAPRTILGAAEYFDFYGSLAATVHGETIPVSTDRFDYTLYDPYGVVGMICPWNAPVNQAARGAAPALAAGNAVVLKPSEHSSKRDCRVLPHCCRSRASGRSYELCHGLWRRGRCCADCASWHREDRLYRFRWHRPGNRQGGR